MKAVLAALFDLTKGTAPLHTFKDDSPHKRPYDTYASRGKKRYTAALTCLAEHGLAHEESVADTELTVYRLDETARLALDE